MPFRDRIEAGRHLAGRLSEYRGRQAMVVGLAWGGVAVARAIADDLAAPLDVRVAHHLHAPDAEGTSFGAVTALGEAVLENGALRRLMLPPGYTEALIHRQRALATQQELALRGAARRGVAGRPVILVDDGVCTGLKMRAAIRDLRREDPSEIVIAAPVIATPALAALRAEADWVVALESADPLTDLGRHYDVFDPMSAEEVHALVVHQVG